MALSKRRQHSLTEEHLPHKVKKALIRAPTVPVRKLAYQTLEDIQNACASGKTFYLHRRYRHWWQIINIILGFILVFALPDILRDQIEVLFVFLGIMGFFGAIDWYWAREVKKSPLIITPEWIYQKEMSEQSY